MSLEYKYGLLGLEVFFTIMTFCALTAAELTAKFDVLLIIFLTKYYFLSFWFFVYAMLFVMKFSSHPVTLLECLAHPIFKIFKLSL